MARKKTTALVNWDAELAEYAAKVTETEASAVAGAWLSTRGGQLAFQGAAFPNNELVAIVLDHVLENVFYEGEFDPDVRRSPTCYAFGRDEKALAPFEEAPDKQDSICLTCENNAWGSGKGRGKACKNSRRLALIGAGAMTDKGAVLVEDPDELLATPMAFFNLPVTSVKAWGQYCHLLANVFKRPPFGVYTKIKLVPDEKTMYRITFETVGQVDRSALPAAKARYEEAAKSIEFGYPTGDEDEAPKKSKRGVRKTTSKKKTAKKTTRRKRPTGKY